MRDVVDNLAEFKARGACTDAERRAAVWLHDDLRERGYGPWVETVWVRPQWAWSLVWHAGLGVAVSLAATAVPVVAAGALLLVLSWLLGGLSRLFYRRATQIVVVDPPGPGIKLWLVAHTDASRAGAGFRVRRWFRGVHPTWALVALLLSVVVVGALRGLGLEGRGIGAVQLIPTVGLLAVAAVALDCLLSDYTAGASDAAGVAVALALHEELTQRPPARFSVGLVLAGAGEAWPYGFRTWLRSEQRSSEDTVLVELGPCGSGTVAWSARHPQLVTACGPGGRRSVHRPTTMARSLGSLYVRTVGAAGVPERVRTEHDTPAAVEDAAMEAVYDFVIDSVDRLDQALTTSSATSAGVSATSSHV
ncbi:MAG: hypothetical protein WKF94_12365 [Solirubrobacteraceae bacterium]